MRYDIKLYTPIESKFTSNPIVASGTTQSINAGEPSKVGTSGAIAAMVDGNGTTSERFAGLAKSDSSETASVAGNCTVYFPLPGVIYMGKSKVATNSNTQAKVDALYAKRVVFDLTSTVWTVDDAASDAATNALVIVGGDFTTSTLYFAISTIGNIFH